MYSYWPALLAAIVFIGIIALRIKDYRREKEKLKQSVNVGIADVSIYHDDDIYKLSFTGRVDRFGYTVFAEEQFRYARKIWGEEGLIGLGGGFYIPLDSIQNIKVSYRDRWEKPGEQQ